VNGCQEIFLVPDSHSIVPYLIEILVAHRAPLIKPIIRIPRAAVLFSHLEYTTKPMPPKARVVPPAIAIQPTTSINILIVLTKLK
jgi:hypothetical protein